VHRQRIALWVISLVLATQHTYIQSMLNLLRFISFYYINPWYHIGIIDGGTVITIWYQLDWAIKTCLVLTIGLLHSIAIWSVLLQLTCKENVISYIFMYYIYILVYYIYILVYKFAYLCITFTYLCIIFTYLCIIFTYLWITYLGVKVYQLILHLSNLWFFKKFQPIGNKNILRWPCFLPHKDLSCKVWS